MSINCIVSICVVLNKFNYHTIKVISNPNETNNTHNYHFTRQIRTLMILAALSVKIIYINTKQFQNQEEHENRNPRIIKKVASDYVSAALLNAMLIKNFMKILFHGTNLNSHSKLGRN